MSISGLVLNNIYKSFDSQNNKDERFDAVQDISFSLSYGEFVSIVGPSGCGKSTILRLIAGLIAPTSGKIKEDGALVQGLSKQRGMVFQEYSLFPHKTVRGNIEYSFKVAGNLDKNIGLVDEYIKKIGLEKFENSYPSTLSGGMKQRVALARTLICKPKILLLDEPLSALDAFTRMNMQDEIIALWKETLPLVIMVTHDVEEAVYMSTKIILMQPHPGRVKRIIDIPLLYKRERGSKEFVEFRNEILNELFENNR